MVYITFLYCHSCTRSEDHHYDRAIPFDCEERKPCIGRCGHSICLQCVEKSQSKRCPICKQEDSFIGKTVNYGAIPIIEDYQQKAWENMKELWKGKGFETSRCAGCLVEVNIAKLRICHDCSREMDITWNFNRLCSNYVELQSRVLCANCIENYHHGHTHSRIMTLSAPQHNIRKTTADVIYAFFENWMEKSEGFMNCELRKARIYYTCELLKNPITDLNRGKCGWFRDKIKAEVNKQIIENIEKQVKDWHFENEDGDPNMRGKKCECVRIYEEMGSIGYEKVVLECLAECIKRERMEKTTITNDILGCPLYFDYNEKQRIELRDHGYEIPPYQIIVTPGRTECPLCFVNITHETPYKKVPVDNFIDIFEKVWIMETPSLDSLCPTCLQSLDHYYVGRSCEDIEKEEVYDQLSHTRSEFNEKVFQQYCKYGKCLLKKEEYWKYIIKDGAIREAFEMLSHALNRVKGVIDCKLRRERMELTLKELEKILEFKQNGIRTLGDEFVTKMAEKEEEANRLLTSLKSQWNEFRFGNHENQNKCKCSKVWRHYENIFMKLPTQEQFGDRYDQIGDQFREIAHFQLDQIISGCPLNFERGLSTPMVIDVYGKVVTIS